MTQGWGGGEAGDEVGEVMGQIRQGLTGITGLCLVALNETNVAGGGTPCIFPLFP